MADLGRGGTGSTAARRWRGLTLTLTFPELGMGNVGTCLATKGVGTHRRTLLCATLDRRRSDSGPIIFFSIRKLQAFAADDSLLLARRGATYMKDTLHVMEPGDNSRSQVGKVTAYGPLTGRQIRHKARLYEKKETSAQT